MKRVVAIVLLTAFAVVMLAPRAEAGGEAAIGLGVGILVGTILGIAIAAPPPAVAGPPYLVPGPVTYGPPRQWVPGHWQDRWIPTATQLHVWVPGHHDAYGHWTPSHYETQVIQSSTWTRVWVSGHWE
jgi:hypothetical protein